MATRVQRIQANLKKALSELDQDNERVGDPYEDGLALFFAMEYVGRAQALLAREVTQRAHASRPAP